MLGADFPFLLPCNLAHDLPERLHGLAEDVGRLCAGAEPNKSDLAHAPLIADWRVALTPTGLRLLGRVASHPQPSGTTRITSQLWVADADGGWVRTLSRFYRLGAPFAEEEAADREGHGAPDITDGL